MPYNRESGELDAEIGRVIAAWHKHGRGLSDAEFEDLAQRIFAYQLRYDEPYARYCGSLGITSGAMPASWHEIPAVPTAAFKEATLATFDPARAALAFETSGTTGGLGGRHYMETRALYDASLLAGFDRFMLADGARLRYFNLVPNPADRPQSSLGYMMGRVCAERGDGNTGWYLRGDDLFVDAFVADARAAVEDGVPVCIAGTAFAFVQLCDELAERGATFAFAPGSRIMETGGFKGRSRIVSREELYAAMVARFGIPDERIVAEYSMTELSSQWYDGADRIKLAPPWLRARVTGADGKTLPSGVVGALVHVDLANRSSCLAVQTEDLGAVMGDGIVLIGREQGAELRGCSLDAETLRAVR
ncbi:MAG TPA: hypothetical protein VIG46_05685 [Candidatus Baltobacteraceae bacterium]